MRYREQFILRSQVNPKLKRKKLFWGTSLGILGALLMGYSGIFFSITTLQIWGFAIFAASSTLIAVGFVPFRRLNKLEIHPHQIGLNEIALHFYHQGKKTFTIPLESIDRYDYDSEADPYGIKVWLKSPIPKKILVSDQRFNMLKFQQRSARDYNCDLFLPYFTEKAFQQLMDKNGEQRVMNNE